MSYYSQIKKGDLRSKRVTGFLKVSEQSNLYEQDKEDRRNRRYNTIGKNKEIDSSMSPRRRIATAGPESARSGGSIVFDGSSQGSRSPTRRRSSGFVIVGGANGSSKGYKRIVGKSY